MPQVGTNGLNNAVDAAGRLAEQLAEPGCIEAWLVAMRTDLNESTTSAVRKLGTFDLPPDLAATLLRQLTHFYLSNGGLETGLRNLSRFLERVRGPLALVTLFERDVEALPVLMRVLSIDGPLAEIVIEDVESFDLLRLVQGRAISRDELLADLQSEIGALDSERSISSILRRFHNREMLRIGYGLLTGDATASWVGEQLALIAEVICSAAFEHVRRKMGKQFHPNLDVVGIAIIALGDCGSQRMHFKSPLPILILFADATSHVNAAPERAEAVERIAKSTVSLLAGKEAEPFAVSLRFWPDFDVSRHAASVDHALRALDEFGRTWQRIEMMSATIVAGSQETGIAFLSQLEPWLYRRRLDDADVDGLLFQYRKWRRVAKAGVLEDLWQGIRILQLTLGGEQPDVRGANPYSAIGSLAKAGAWKKSEATILAEDLRELSKLQLLAQLGAVNDDKAMASLRFNSAHDCIAAALENIFGEASSPSFVSELVMDPLPNDEVVSSTLAPFGFENPLDGGRAICELARESTPFLSTRKSRHFLSRIAPALVTNLSQTPSPDHSLLTLSRVVESLGAKGALWELFLANPPSMELCVRLCAYSPYLSNILIASPGFIDELLDSLQLARLPSLSAMESRLEDLCKGAELDQAVHEFKNALHLRIGVRDILGKEQVTSTHQSLAQTAEAILRRVVVEQLKELVQKHGAPKFDASHGSSECRHVLLVSGKVGGLEPNYHSEIEIAVIYEADGMTLPESRSMASVSCAHFFGQVTQRSIRRLTSRGKLGQLYVVNNDFRPLGAQGPLAASLEALRHYYLDSPRTWRDLLWLCKSRPAGGDAVLAVDVMTILHEAIAGARITRADINDFRQYRAAQAEGARPLNLKRAAGGTQHIELLVQFLLLAFAGRFPRILAPGTLAALDRLAAERLLTPEEADTLSERYRFLRAVESRLRLMNTQARHDLPENEAELRSLAMFLGVDSAERLREQCEAAMNDVKATIEAREVRLASESFN